MSESLPEPVESLSPWSDFCLREVEPLRVGGDGEPNYLIEGDNLAALMLLQGTHEGTFDLIYIDPPHNTRSRALTYSDDFTRAGDAFPHARWLAFMERRLRLARNLMSGGGSIFISIDDREAAVLKLLCDELFGERNFVANIVWEKKAHAQNDARWLSVNHESILVCAKGKRTWRPNLLSRTAKMDAGCCNPDDDPRGAWRDDNLLVKTYSPAGDYPIELPSGRAVSPPKGLCWRASEARFRELVADGRIWFGPSGNNVPRLKRFLSEVRPGAVCKTVWRKDEVGDTGEGTRELKRLFDGDVVFTSPKPVRLIRRIVDLATKPDSLVLDFFAGSGTTGQAVMEHNVAHSGSRRFVLVTSNENGICRDVAYERCRRAIEPRGSPRASATCAWKRRGPFAVFDEERIGMKRPYGEDAHTPFSRSMCRQLGLVDPQCILHNGHVLGVARRRPRRRRRHVAAGHGGARLLHDPLALAAAALEV